MIYPPKDKHKFYYPDYIEYALKQIKHYDFSNHTFSQITSIIRDYLEAIPITENTIKEGTFLARARTKEDDIPYNRLSKITIRNKQFVKSFGRANIPGQAIFYCSPDHEVAIREATQWHITDFGTLVSRNMLQCYNPNVNFVTVSIWKVIKDIKVAALFLNPDAMSVNPVVRLFGDKTKIDNFNNWDERVLRSTNLILEFFSNEFAKTDIRTESEYLLSAYYANQIYLTSAITKRLDGVTYPTVALAYKGENVAITEEAYKDKLEFVTANHNYVANIELKGRPMAIGGICEVVDRKDDILIWKDLPTGKILLVDESE